MLGNAREVSSRSKNQQRLLKKKDKIFSIFPMLKGISTRRIKTDEITEQEYSNPKQIRQKELNYLIKMKKAKDQILSQTKSRRVVSPLNKCLQNGDDDKNVWDRKTVSQRKIEMTSFSQVVYNIKQKNNTPKKESNMNFEDKKLRECRLQLMGSGSPQEKKMRTKHNLSVKNINRCKEQQNSSITSTINHEKEADIKNKFLQGLSLRRLRKMSKIKQFKEEKQRSFCQIKMVELQGIRQSRQEETSRRQKGKKALKSSNSHYQGQLKTKKEKILSRMEPLKMGREQFYPLMKQQEEIGSCIVDNRKQKEQQLRVSWNYSGKKTKIASNLRQKKILNRKFNNQEQSFNLEGWKMKETFQEQEF